METKMIGNKIAKARKEINISQAELAQRLFISPQAVGKWERGESIPDLITFNRLAEILGVDLNYFSDSFSSADTETAPVESIVKESVSSTKQKNKLSWNMSNGNWVDADFSGLKELHEKFAILSDEPVSMDVWVALAWCIGIILLVWKHSGQIGSMVFQY